MRAIWLTALLVAAASAPRTAVAQLLEPEPPRRPSPFDRGRFSLGLGLGTQGAFDERYFVVGGGIGYFVLDGLEVGISGSKWFGSGPSIANVTPTLRYIVVVIPGPVKPFVGTFYSHWFIGDAQTDVDSIGGTLGIVWNQGGGLVLSLGATVERIISDCIDDCVDIYPAFSLGISF